MSKHDCEELDDFGRGYCQGQRDAMEVNDELRSRIAELEAEVRRVCLDALAQQGQDVTRIAELEALLRESRGLMGSTFTGLALRIDAALNPERDEWPGKAGEDAQQDAYRNAPEPETHG